MPLLLPAARRLRRMLICQPQSRGGRLLTAENPTKTQAITTWSDRAGSAGSLTLASGGKSKTDAIRGAGRTDLRLAGETQTKEKAIADAGLSK
jgi:hypothetical protein